MAPFPLSSSSRLARFMLPNLFRHLQCHNIRCSSSPVTIPMFQGDKGLSQIAKNNSSLKFGLALYRSVANIEENKEKIDVNCEAKARSVSVREAYELLQAGHRYLDVRTSDEFNSGHPPAAINVPYFHILRNGGEEISLKNPKFLVQVSSEFGKQETILVGCRLGRRSLMAATELLAAGFSHVIDVAGGYVEWKENGLPIRKSSVANNEEDKEKTDVNSKPRSVSVDEAYELLQAGHRYIDVRTCGEFKAGHPPATINIPYFHIFDLKDFENGGEISQKNHEFLDQVTSEFGKEETIIVGCRIGKRSLMAATELHAAVSLQIIEKL